MSDTGGSNPLRAVVLNCTLKSGEEPSSTAKLLAEVLDALGKHDVSGEMIRVVDHEVYPGAATASAAHSAAHLARLLKQAPYPPQ